MNSAKAATLDTAIAKLPRVQLASVRPTPLEPMQRLAAHLNSPALHIKRDDLTGLAFGGNKTRMFEFSLADALAAGADTIVSGAAVQSNYCRQLAAACAKLDLALHLILRPVRDIDKAESQGNNLLQHLLGAQITVMEEGKHIIQTGAIQAKVDELTRVERTVAGPGKQLTYHMTLIKDIRLSPKILSSTLLDSACTKGKLDKFFTRGIVVGYVIRDKDGRLLHEARVTPSICDSQETLAFYPQQRG